MSLPGERTPEEMEAGMVSVVDALAKACPEKADAGQLLAHMVAGFLAGNPPTYIDAFLYKIRKMTRGEFDR